MEDRRKEDRRKLSGKPFLAQLIGALPEDRRRGDRRRRSEPIETVRGELAGGTDPSPPG